MYRIECGSCGQVAYVATVIRCASCGGDVSVSVPPDLPMSLTSEEEATRLRVAIRADPVVKMATRAGFVWILGIVVLLVAPDTLDPASALLVFASAGVFMLVRWGRVRAIRSILEDCVSRPARVLGRRVRSFDLWNVEYEIGGEIRRAMLFALPGEVRSEMKSVPVLASPVRPGEVLLDRSSGT